LRRGIGRVLIGEAAAAVLRLRQFDSVTTIYLSLGSNMGDRARNMGRAVAALASHGVRVMRQSSLYETEPVEFRDQDWFLNSVVEAETDLTPEGLMDALLDVERSLGRRRLVPKGPRLIDLDILLFGSSSVRTPGLEIPHPRMAERRFVLVPLSEIAPDAWHPVLQKTIAALLAGSSDQSAVRPAVT
jgi:2-amino-4-hydroxy-6-hydroxymethyldihydropteridine diphosphokinase